MKTSTLVYLAMLAVLAPTTHAADGLVAYWPFDTDFTNAQGASAFDGTATGTAEISSDDVKAGSGALKIDDDGKTRSHVTVLGDFVGSACMDSAVARAGDLDSIAGRRRPQPAAGTMIRD